MSAYLIGAVFIVLLLTVFAGVVHHLTISPRGPGLFRKQWHEHLDREKSAILDQAQRLEEFERHRHFHFIAEQPKLPENERPVCFICHSDYPHSKNKRIRALMNIHTQFLVCETCHIQERPGLHIVHKWYSPHTDNPQGPFYGTDYFPETGLLVKGDGGLTKIAPYYKAGIADKLIPAIQMQDAPLARDYMKVRDRLSPEQREGVKNKFHENIKPKGYQCNVCHSEQSLLDFKQLGFSDTRIDNLLKLDMVGMLENYDQFYLPELFGQ
ncbi:MAG: hypothetical protein P8X96_04400 [Desulfobacteraceae bacterium]